MTVQLSPGTIAKMIGAAALGTPAIVLMIMATVENRSSVLVGWALLAAAAASALAVMVAIDLAVSGGLDEARRSPEELVFDERLRTEELLERIATKIAERERDLRDVSFIRED